MCPSKIHYAYFTTVLSVSVFFGKTWLSIYRCSCCEIQFHALQDRMTIIQLPKLLRVWHKETIGNHQIGNDSIGISFIFVSKQWEFYIRYVDQMAQGLWCFTPLSTIFQLYRGAVSFVGGGNRSNQRKARTCHKSLTNLIT